MKEFMEMLDPYMKYIEGALIAIGILILGWIVSKWVRKLIVKAGEKTNLDAALGKFLGGLARYAVLAATFISALDAVGIGTTSLVAVLGAAGLAVGLALQGSLANFASGVMLLFFRPFTLGDVVEAAGVVGKVDDIGIFFTTLMTPDNQKLIVPNSAVTGGTITNISGQGTRRAEVMVGVAYGADVDQVTELLINAAKGADLVLQDPAPAVGFVDLGASSIDFKVLVWAESANWVAVQGNVRRAAYNALNEAGIDIPYQTVTVVNG